MWARVSLDNAPLQNETSLLRLTLVLSPFKMTLAQVS
jgi:hypothetical protein